MRSPWNGCIPAFQNVNRTSPLQALPLRKDVALSATSPPVRHVHTAPVVCVTPVTLCATWLRMRAEMTMRRMKKDGIQSQRTPLPAAQSLMTRQVVPR